MVEAGEEGDTVVAEVGHLMVMVQQVRTYSVCAVLMLNSSYII